MERKRPVGNAADSPSFARHTGSSTDHVASAQTRPNEQNALPPPPQSFGFPAPVNTNASAATRGWRPGRVGGRHDSPLYGKNRKRPSSSSIDSNVSWSGSEIESISGFSAAQSEQEQVSRLSWASSVVAREEATATGQQDLASAGTLFGRVAVKSTGTSAEGADDLSPGTPHADSRVNSRANSSENVFVASSPVYDEEKNGPQSCPSMFNTTRQPQFAIDKLHQLRNNELIPSKFLPTRTSVDSLMGYVRELQLSEATLRKQLLKNKQHTEEELTHSLSKVNELERTVQEVERDRELARRKLEEQEQLIRDLAAKLKQAEAAKSKGSTVPVVKELPPIAEEASQQTEIDTSTVTVETNEHLDVPPPVPTPAMQQQPSSISPGYRDQSKGDNSATQFGLASPRSPRSPDRPLWDPWVSGGTNPTKNLPPVFTIGSTGLDPAVSSSTPAAPTSMTDPTTPSVGEYELKSVLLSPREKQDQIEASGNGKYVQHEEQNTATVPPGTQQEFTQQNRAATFDMGPMPPQRDSHQQAFTSSGKPNAAHGVQSVVPMTESSCQAVPMTSSANDNLLEHKHSATGSNELQGQQWPSATSTSSFVSAEGASIGEMVPPPSSSSAVPPSQASVKNAQFQYDESEVATGSSQGTQVAQPEQQSYFVAEDVATGVRSALPSGSSLPLAPATSEIQVPSPASAQIESIADSAEPVSLETLLIDFFTEVDNKRLKMAKVYGKRYAGREKWLFAELSKRYGAVKVAALKARFENGSGGDPSAVTNHGGGSNDSHAKNSSDVSTHAKPGQQGHPRHPQFVHPPTPSSNVDLSAGVPSVSSPVAPFQERDESRSQTRQVAEEVNTCSSPNKRTSANPISPQKGPTGGSIPSLSGPPPSFPKLQETGEGYNATAVGTDGPAFRSGPARMTRHGAPTGQFNHPPSQPQTEMENSNTAPLGLRQRHQLSARSQTNTGAERPVVTLESLLKELYKKHQPDKLKNVSIVAKEYAGRERELVGLLKGKYGVLSVKRLEENLDVLERAHRARMGDKDTSKKRGCFVRTISLVFWLSVLLYFSFGAVFVSFVVLDAWECRSFDSEEQELEAAGDCLPLKKELETFMYERIATYVGQSHPDACFCSEWKARQSALFGTFSGEDLVKLARLVPFSPKSFGAPWIATMKEQVPSQKFYDSYAKPVVDLSLDAGLFVWSSVVELAGYAEVSEMSTVVKNTVDYYFGETAEVDNQHFDDDGNADVVLIKEADVAEDEAVAVEPGLLEQVPVEEELDTFDEKLKTDDRATSDRATGMTDNVLVEDEDVIPVSEGMTTANEEGVSLLSETDGEEHATIDVLELEDVALVEAAESIDAGEQESTNEAEVEETWTDASTPAEQAESVGGADDGAFAFTETEEGDFVVEKTYFNDIEEVSEAESVGGTDDGVSAFTETEEGDVAVENTYFSDIEEVSKAESVGGTDDGVSAFTETEEGDVAVEKTFFNDIEEVSEAESVGDADDGVSAFTETEEGDVAVEKTSFNDVEEVAEAAVEVNQEVSAEDVVAVSEGVVEVEVRQEGLDLSYAESETDEALIAESAEVSILSVDKELEPLFGGGEEPSALSKETKVVEAEHASEDVFIDAAEEDSAPVMRGVDEDFAAPTSSAIDAGVEVMKLESDIATASEVFEIEAENVEKEPTGSEVLQIEPSHALNSDFSLVIEESESPNITNREDIEKLALNSAGEEIAASLLSEGPESKADKELDELTEAEAQETETEMTSDEEEGVPSKEDDANVLAEEEFILAKSELEPSLRSSGGDAEVILAEEVSDDGYMAIKTKSDDDHEETVTPAEMEDPISDNGDDENMLEEKSEQADDEMVIPAEVEVDSELEVEEYVGGVLSEDKVAPELTEDLENQDYDFKESVDEASAVSVEIEAAGEGSSLLSEVKVENLEEVSNEMDEVGAESTAPNEIEVTQSVSEVDLVNELGEGLVASFEATVVSDDEDTVSVEHAEEVDKDVGDTEAVGSSLSEVDSPIPEEAECIEDGPIADDVENLGIADEETHISDEVEAAALEAATVTHQVDAIDDSEVSDADGPTAVDGETTELQRAVDKSSAPAIEEEANNDFASAVNEVLARLVEPFEAAKTAAM